MHAETLVSCCRARSMSASASGMGSQVESWAPGVSTRGRPRRRGRRSSATAASIARALCLQSAYQRNGPDRDLRFRPMFIGRDAGIRTRDPLTPSQVRYQAALHPVLGAELTRWINEPLTQRVNARSLVKLICPLPHLPHRHRRRPLTVFFAALALCGGGAFRADGLTAGDGARSVNVPIALPVA